MYINVVIYSESRLYLSLIRNKNGKLFIQFAIPDLNVRRENIPR